MTKIKTNLIKISIVGLTGFLFINILINSIAAYQSENSTLILFVYILGTILGLVVRSGLTFIFWYSYNIKYPDEKYNERIFKKILATFLFLGIASTVNLGTGMPIVFIICTLIIIQKKNIRSEVKNTD